MQESRTDYYKQILIKGNYFPYYEKRFKDWIGVDGNYHALRTKLAISCDQSKKQIAIDIGANVGLMSRILAKAYDLVLAIEPSSQNRACLYRNMDIACNNVIVIPYAAGEKNEISKLRINPVNCGGSAIDEEYCKSDITETVRCYKIDDIIDNFARSREVSLIKIDIQGREIAALKGAAITIKKHKPIIMCETTNECDEKNQKHIDPIQILEIFGYIKFIKMENDSIYIHKDKINNKVLEAAKEVTKLKTRSTN